MKILILFGVIIIPFIFIIWCCLAVAGRADRRMEKMFEEIQYNRYLEMWNHMPAQSGIGRGHGGDER